MTPRRLRAPSEEGAVLAVPALADWPQLVAANRARLADWDHDFQGRRGGRLRALARAEALDVARAFHLRHGLGPVPSFSPDVPIVATGHQPEMFHPGVWAKNFAVARLATAVGGLGLNLIADGDVLKRTFVRVPTPGGAALSVPFDEFSGAVPLEDQFVKDEGLFESFGERALKALGGLVPDPLVHEYWPRALARKGEVPQLGLRLALARHDLEPGLGANNAELRLGGVAETDGFFWFAVHLLAHLPRFVQVHDEALGRYRATYKIRSSHHPVADLRREGDWLEAPFWAWRASGARRRPLWARQATPKTIELRIGGEDAPVLTLPLAPDMEGCCAVERLRELPRLGARLRTRALTTTLFMRSLLCDLFVHGIGGAKYDELGDEIARGFFGAPLPDYATLTMTMRLGVPYDAEAPNRLVDLGRTARDLLYNPDRYLPGPIGPEIEGLVQAKGRAIAGPQGTRPQRVARYFEVRRLNDEMAMALRGQIEGAHREREALRRRIKGEEVFRGREFAFALHSRARTEDALNQGLRPLG